MVAVIASITSVFHTIFKLRELVNISTYASNVSGVPVPKTRAEFGGSNEIQRNIIAKMVLGLG